MKSSTFTRFLVPVIVLTSLSLSTYAQMGVSQSGVTFTPQSLFHLHDNHASGAVFQITNTTSGNDAPSRGFGLYAQPDFRLVFKNQYNHPSAGFDFTTYNGFENIRLSILNNGNIGIGTSVPDFKLHIKGSSNVSQLVVDASISQTLVNPLLLFRNAGGSGILSINANNNTNLFIGIDAGRSITSGQSNVLVGLNSGRNITSGSFNTGIGQNSLQAATTGSDNTAMGIQSLNSNVSSRENIAIGPFSQMYMNPQTTYGRNIAIGHTALQGSSTPAQNTGYENIALGTQALTNMESGFDNIAIGTYAGSLITTGTHNISIGKSSGTSAADLTNSIAIGYQTTNSTSNTVRLGNSSISTLYCQGAYAATSASNPNVYVNPSGQIMRSTAVIPGGSGSVNQVAFWSGTGSLSGNSALFWDNTNLRLGLGTTSPQQKLTIEGTLGLLETGTSPIYHTILQAADQTGDLTFTLPSGTGTSGQVLSTNGGGVMSWISGESPLTFTNGLTRSSNTAKLGGALTESTTITQDAAESLTFTNGGSGNTIVNLSNTGDFQIQDAGSAFFTASDNGFVGIGTTDPEYKLSLSGPFGIRETGASPQYHTVFATQDQSMNLIYYLPSATGDFNGSLTRDLNGYLTWTEKESPLTFGNGLTRSSNTVELGGTLSRSTSIIQTGAFSLSFSNGSTANTIFNLTSTGDFQIQDNGTTFFSATDAGNINISNNGAGNTLINLASTGDFRIQDAGTDFFTATDGGMIGIGLTNPTSTLHISGSFYDNNLTSSNSVFNLNSTGDFQIQDAGSTFFSATDAGLIGIGTSNPVYKLHLVGLDTIGSVLIAPNEATDGYNSELLFAEDNDYTYGMSIKYRGAENKLYVYGKGGATQYGPHISIARDAGGMNFYNRDHEQTILINASESGTGDAGKITMNNETGSAVIIFDGNYNGTSRGRVTTSEIDITGGSDIAEPFHISDVETSVTPGMVLTIDPDNPGKLKISEKEYDRCVAGIVSGAGDINPGLVLRQKGHETDGQHMVALTGRVYCLADASYGSIEPGDLLTSSATEGHAMKVTNFGKSQGAIIGKAMSSLKDGKGLVLVLVSLQ